MGDTTSVLKKSYGKNSVDLIEEILKLYDIKLERGSGLVGSEINKGGFPLMNFSPLDAIKYLADLSLSKE